MPIIELKTKIRSRIGTCFDLSRSLDLHLISAAKTKETIIAGRRSGLIELHETVTWRAIHLGVSQKLTTKITAFTYPTHFCDEQTKGVFRSMKHDHYFMEEKEGVMMTDRFEFESPFGILGRWFNYLFLTRYLEKFLIERNRVIKEYAETDGWKDVLN